MKQGILNMLVTIYLANKAFDYIDPWGETLASIAWAIQASYHHAIQATPNQAVFGRYMIFNLVSVVDWQVITDGKQQQVEIDNVQENTRQVTHDYAIGDLVYVEMTGIYPKIDYKKQGPYIITEEKLINIRRSINNFIEKAECFP